MLGEGPAVADPYISNPNFVSMHFLLPSMLYLINFRQILRKAERRFNRHFIPLNHLSLFSCVCKTVFFLCS
jgi:hypothetical protein